MELLLVDMTYQHSRLGADISALQDKQGQRFLPLQLISNDLGFRLRIDLTQKSATGFLRSPSDRIELNGIMGTSKSRLGSIRFAPSLCFNRDKELYIESELLAKLTGLKFNWRMDKLEIDVLSEAPLTIQKSWVINHLIDLNAQASQVSKSAEPTVTTPYRLYSMPTLNFQLNTITDLSEGSNEFKTTPSIEGFGDLALMGANYRFSTDASGRPTMSLSLSRKSTQGNLFGSLHAKEILFGDLSIAPRPLYSRGKTGRGLTVSNFTLPGEDFITGTQTEGRAQPGSLIELYRDDRILSATMADDKGRYAFSGIQLEPGPNDLRIVVVGPNGDIHEEQRTLYSFTSGLKSGQKQYRFGIVQPGRSLLGSGGHGIQDPWEVSGEFQSGLSSNSWMSMTGVSLANTNALGVGYHSWLGGTLCNLQTMASDSGGTAFSAGLSQKFGNTFVSFEHVSASGVIGAGELPELNFGATSATKLRIDGQTECFNQPLSYGFSVARQDGLASSTELRARFSGGLGSLYFSNSITFRSTPEATSSTGMFQVRKQFGSSTGRLELGYGLGNSDTFQLARLTMDRKISSDYRVRYGLENDPTRNHPVSVLGTLYKTIGQIAVGVNLSADSGGVRASLLLSTGIGSTGQSGRTMLQRTGTASSGTVTTRVFVDKDLSGTYDDGEQLLENIDIKVSGRSVQKATGKKGVCVLDRLPADQEMSISLNEDTFEDPSWITARPSITVQPRAGTNIALDFAVIASAEIEGRIVGLDFATSAPQSLTAELLNANGLMVYSSLTDDEGTFVFSRVLPGTYNVRVSDGAGQIVGLTTLTVAPGSSTKGVEVVYQRPTIPDQVAPIPEQEIRSAKSEPGSSGEQDPKKLPETSHEETPQMTVAESNESASPVSSHTSANTPSRVHKNSPRTKATKGQVDHKAFWD